MTPDAGWKSYDPKFKKYLHIGKCEMTIFMIDKQSIRSVCLSIIAGPKPRMRDHYKSHQMAVWLNLIPDLLSAAEAEIEADSATKAKAKVSTSNDLEPMLSYKSYNELLPLIPSLKRISFSRDGSTPSSSEVVWPNASKTHNVDNIFGFNEVSNTTTFANEHVSQTWLKCDHSSISMPNFAGILQLFHSLERDHCHWLFSSGSQCLDLCCCLLPKRKQMAESGHQG